MVAISRSQFSIAVTLYEFVASHAFPTGNKASCMLGSSWLIHAKTRDLATMRPAR